MKLTLYLTYDKVYFKMVLMSAKFITRQLKALNAPAGKNI